MSYFKRRTFLTAGAAWAAGLSARGADAPPPAAKREKPEKDPYDDAVLIKGEPPLPPEGAFTLAVLPDTQHYAEKYPDTFMAQTRWIAEQRTARRIAGVLHLGDITNHSSAAEWENAVRAMTQLGELPLCIVPGNHDYGPGGNGTVRETLCSQYFPPAFYKDRPAFGGFYDKEPERTENSFHLLDAGGRKLLLIGLEFGPRPDVVRWAKEIAARHQDREAILATHVFTYHDDSRYHWAKHGNKQDWNPHAYGMARSPGSVTDGEELWQSLVQPAGNFLFTINGHVLRDGLGRMTSKDAKKRRVHQMLVNFQMRPKGGDGWLRLIEFHPDRSLHICDYSPVRGERNESQQNRFTLKPA
jgi:hypothetical protein